MKNKSKTIILVAVAVFVIVAGTGFWYWQRKSSPPVTQMSVDQKTADVSLGNQILESTQNLLRDKFPETNPLKRIIKNPF